MDVDIVPTVASLDVDGFHIALREGRRVPRLRRVLVVPHDDVAARTEDFDVVVARRSRDDQRAVVGQDDGAFVHVVIDDFTLGGVVNEVRVRTRILQRNRETFILFNVVVALNLDFDDL